MRQSETSGGNAAGSSPAARRVEHYLDAAAFTKLFRQRRKNHSPICLGLQLLAAGVARRFWFASETARQEAISNALLYAIERIDRFKFRAGNDAFAYYTSLIYRNIMRQLGRVRRHESRALSFTDTNYDSEGGSYERGNPGDRQHRDGFSTFDRAIPYARAI